MWRWRIVWIDKDGKKHELTSEACWENMTDAYKVAADIIDLARLALYELGAEDVLDFEIVEELV